MKWPFLNKLNLGRTPKKRIDPKKNGKRCRRTRFSNLMCTIKRRPLFQDAKCCSRNSTQSAESNLEQYGDCVSRNSTAIAYPDFVGDPRRMSHFVDKLHTNNNNNNHLKQWGNQHHYLDTATRSAFCPTCRNVVILMPQKRLSLQISGSPPPPYELYSRQKRVTSDVIAPGRLLRTIGFQSDPFSETEHFNPVYDSIRSISDVDEDEEGSGGSTYCSVAGGDDDDNDELLPQVNAVSPQLRPKLVAVRRRANHYVGMAAGGIDNLQNWLNETASDTSMLSSYVYSSVNEDYSVVAAEVCVGDPWDSSTLKRSRKEVSCFDTGTMYDEVASETEEEIVTRAGKDKLPLRRKFSGELDTIPAQIKRLRREFYVCEE